MESGEIAGTRSQQSSADPIWNAPPAPITTKLTPPMPSAGLLPRSDLVAELAATPGKLCLISAPAGWGKTSLLAAWHDAHRGNARFAFLHLDPDDDSAASFWACLLTALHVVLPELASDATRILRTPGVDPMRRIVPTLVNELADVEQPLLIVLDDYHVLNQQAIHDSVVYLIDHLPAAVRLVISTRADPPLHLGRLRASGELVEVRASRLRLSEQETTILLQERFDLHLDRAGVQLLCDRTEGWPAAIHLAGLSLRSEPDHRQFIESFAGDNRNVADYLTGEVLARLPSERRTFLLRSSILDRLIGPLCDAVVGTEGSASILVDLERDNLFLVPLDSRRRWYRYHNLFRDWLQHELRKTEADLIPELHSRASAWYSEQGFAERSIVHAVAAGSRHRAAALLDDYLEDWPNVNWSAVSRWIDKLTDDAIAGRPMVAIAKVMTAWMRGDFSQGFRWIGTAEDAISDMPAELRPTTAVIVELFRAFGELLAGDMEVAHSTFERIAEQERASASLAFAMATQNLGITTFWTTGALESIPPLREGIIAYEQASMPDSGATALLAAAYAEIGDWSAAESTARAALELPPPFASYEYPYRMAAHYALGQVRIARGEVTEGVAQIEEGLQQARAWIEPIFIAYGCLLLADVYEGYTEKRGLVREARQVISNNRGRGRIGQMVTNAERRLSIRRPSIRSAGTVHVDTLTVREQDVLRLLQSELTLPQIARELYVSYNTVKGYTKSIYRKLGVTSRTSAVETAKELDLV